jgi:hypothetical protein
VRQRTVIAAALAAAGIAALPVAGAAPASAGTTVSPKCLKVPAPLVSLLRASLSFSAGGNLLYTRAVKSPKLPNVYFVSAQIRAQQLGAKRPLGTWVVDKLQSTASASPLNAAARAYSDLATPDAGTVRLTMASPGALASQTCVKKLMP